MFGSFFFFCHTFTAAHNKLNHINISTVLNISMQTQPIVLLLAVLMT